MSKFDMFKSSNISPVTTPPPRMDRVMQYSKHSKENLQRQSESESEITSPRNQQFDQNGSHKRPSLDQGTQGAWQSTPNAVQAAGDVGGDGDGTLPISPRTAAKLKLDLLVTEHAQAETGTGHARKLLKLAVLTRIGSWSMRM